MNLDLRPQILPRRLPTVGGALGVRGRASASAPRPQLPQRAKPLQGGGQLLQFQHWRRGVRSKLFGLPNARLHTPLHLHTCSQGFRDFSARRSMSHATWQLLWCSDEVRGRQTAVHRAHQGRLEVQNGDGSAHVEDPLEQVGELEGLRGSPFEVSAVTLHKHLADHVAKFQARGIGLQQGQTAQPADEVHGGEATHDLRRMRELELDLVRHLPTQNASWRVDFVHSQVRVRKPLCEHRAVGVD
mmetsp:Transcript_97662/g.276257  ORF Transcript_97662/g.276257 Transcript_97662/m.276257 type:complete len:243 (-) Transcript_97662:335-1063(-)